MAHGDRRELATPLSRIRRQVTCIVHGRTRGTRLNREGN